MESEVVEISTSQKTAMSELGCHFSDNQISIRVFCGRSPKVEIELFKNFKDKSGERISMIKKNDEVWEIHLPKKYIGWHYGFRIIPPADNKPFKVSDFPVADPYSRFLTADNNYIQSPKSLILEEEDYDWEGDTYIKVSDPRELIIYEAHLKDLVAHPSSDSEGDNLVKRFLNAKTGGISHLNDLGVNAVELLPLQFYSYDEPPYGENTHLGVKNSWNKYSKNYWGYMTSFFFAPEPRFVHKYEINKTRTTNHKVHSQFKDLIKELHKNNIAVIMDVVFNHVSQYDLNPLKYLDKDHYFRLDPDGQFRTDSGCGNDLKTESPYARKLIMDSIKYWMETFHIDGFRFDLAHLIDKETLEEIRILAKIINPDVILIAEPWGGGYNPTLFSELKWASWNDQIRNGIKGSDPVHNPGIIFGLWQHETTRLAMENYFTGTILNRANGRFINSVHSVNYLESHDGFTLGDFIRIGLNHSLTTAIFKDKKPVQLSEKELRLNKLAAFSLFASQGIVMIHEGQEWARTKIIDDPDHIDSNRGQIDHNSYEKDDNTNYLNFDEIKTNFDLYQFYKGLISIRKNSKALRCSPENAITFSRYDDSLHFSFHIDGSLSLDPYNYLITINANPYLQHLLHLPPGFWELLVSNMIATPTPIAEIGGILKIPPSSGVLLRKLRDHV